jgi:hypothetical protein
MITGEFTASTPKPNTTTAKIPRRGVLPTMPTPRARKLAVAIGGALAASIVLGLFARWLFTNDSAPARRRAIASAAAPARPTRSAAVAASMPAAVAASRPAASAEPAAALASAPPATAAAPTSVSSIIDLGDGSCSAVVESRLGGAVWIDDQPIGSAPVEVRGLWCGRRVSVRIERPGFVAWHRVLVPQEGRQSRIAATLRRAPAPVRASTDPQPVHARTEPTAPFEPLRLFFE